jgi:RecJ-like exonuclease
MKTRICPNCGERKTTTEHTACDRCILQNTPCPICKKEKENKSNRACDRCIADSYNCPICGKEKSGWRPRTCNDCYDALGKDFMRVTDPIYVSPIFTDHMEWNVYNWDSHPKIKEIRMKLAEMKRSLEPIPKPETEE